MAMDDEIDGALLANAEAAAARWKNRTRIREARTDALTRHEVLAADSPDRLVARLNNIISDVRKSGRGMLPPESSVLRKFVERPLPVTIAELSDQIVHEVITGARDFLSVEFLDRGSAAARSVGRVLMRAKGILRARGTGFLVGPGLLLTNEHVLTSAELADRCVVQMDYEQNRFGPVKQPQEFALEPKRFFLNDHTLDYALVAVAVKSTQGVEISTYGWLPLNGAQGKITISEEDYLNIVQHPRGREKQVVIRNNRVLDMRTAAEGLGPFLHYEGNTEKGSSGAPVMNDGWEVVGLHHSGVPAIDSQGNWLRKDDRIWDKEQHSVEEIKWVANEAVRISSLVAAIESAPLEKEKRAYLNEAMSATASMETFAAIRVPESVVDKLNPTKDVREVSSGRRSGPDREISKDRWVPSATIEVPLKITLSLGRVGNRSAPARKPRPRLPAELLEKKLEAQDFADRDGYARKFLGVSVSLPKVKAESKFGGGALVVPRPARPDDRTELRYHNYSVILCAKRRLAYVSACNLNFAAKETAGRKDGRSTWRKDPRIEFADQLGDRFYDYNDYDRGHLTRRDDVAWGDTFEDAVAANDDTFFYTNSAPQYFLFNRPDEYTGAGLDLWGDLENFISEQGEAQRARLTVFNGPIFGEQDKPLHDALVPLSFYKIVIWRDGTEDPGAVGFVLDQSDLIASLPEEAIDPGRFELRQCRIADIEDQLDLDFGVAKKWDRLGKINVSEAFGAEGIEIASLKDIRL
ncbi:DNA/RNA non-specific endonuclease [Mesorhizobium sp. L-2-11]|uniref:DNA/RNA non-specific endonuclease n=1 Tax=Mesorhizobium sp. L-2-11 TaxID=2744521 RepID=UPI001928D081|nr:DNA/RNA non-specific endonuclease [Mesorhizobium sp. L-2-11]BCH20101.1 hypothetical protein MesoLjLa_69520 [Mesorhizobium sp. L-2-11]